LQQCGGYDGSLNHPTGGYLLQFQPTAGATPPKRPGGPWNARPQTGNPRWDQGLWRKEMRCVLTRGHTAGDRLGANWEREPNLTRRPAASACRTAGSSVAARTPGSSLMAIEGQRAITGLINQTRPSRRLKATFRDGHHILWCRAVLILTRNLEGQMRKQLAFGFAAVAIGWVTIAWAEASIVTPHHDLVRPKAELAPSALTPDLPFQVLRPVY
jgi:hypothetical protein